MHELPRVKPHQTGAAAQRLLRLGRPLRAAGLRDRERRIEAAAAILFTAAAAALALLAPEHPGATVGLSLTLVLAYAALSRLEYRLGTGFTVPTELVLVPMLFALPPAAVPPLCALGHLAGNLPELVRSRLHIERVLLTASDAWHTLGPALVFAIAGVTGPDWGDWPVYLAALAAQVAFDFVPAAARELGAAKAPLRQQLPLMGWVYAIDLLLAPIGLLAAFASKDEPYAFLLVLPFAALFGVFTREREDNIEKADELSKAYRGTAQLLAEVLDDASEYTGSHSRDVVGLCAEVGAHMGLEEDLRRQTEFAALLHDIGKIAIPKEILDKPAKLTEEEWALMRTHTIEGQRMLNQVGGTLADVGRAVRASHERWDGGGYPDGLEGEQIPLSARIVSCCDAFHAMTTDRPYRKAMSTGDAAAELRDCTGTQFDPDVVEALLAVLAPGAAPDLRVAEDSSNGGDPAAAPSGPKGLHYPSLTGELEAHAEHIAAVARATHKLARTNERDEARGAICDAALSVSGADLAILLEPAPEGGYAETARAGARDGQPLTVRDLDPGQLNALVGEDADGAVHVEPVVRDSHDLGAIAIVWPDRMARMPEAVAATMRLLAAEAAVALERTDLLVRLKNAVRIDELTGALNRSAWGEELRRELSRSRRESRPLSVVLLDVDHFKAFNDRNGHRAGDDLLRSSAAGWRGELRLTDQLGRYGGDEFIVLLPGCDIDSGRALVERLSAATADKETCSAGIAEWDGSENASDLIERADRALLVAKQRGRNQVVPAS